MILVCATLHNTGRRKRHRDRPPLQKECREDNRRCGDHDTSLSSKSASVDPEQQEGQQSSGPDLPSYFNAALAGDTSSPHIGGTSRETDHSPLQPEGTTLNTPPQSQATPVDDESWSDQEAGLGDPSPKMDRGGGNHGNLVPYTDSEVEEGELISDEET